MSTYQLTGEGHCARIIVLRNHPQGGTTHRELDNKEQELVRIAEELFLMQFQSK